MCGRACNPNFLADAHISDTSNRVHTHEARLMLSLWETQVFRRHRVDAVFSGHIHACEQLHHASMC